MWDFQSEHQDGPEKTRAIGAPINWTNCFVKRGAMKHADMTEDGIAYFYLGGSMSTELCWATMACYFRSAGISRIIVEPAIEAVMRSSSQVTASSRLK